MLSGKNEVSSPCSMGSGGLLRRNWEMNVSHIDRQAVSQVRGDHRSKLTVGEPPTRVACVYAQKGEWAASDTG